jgi:hypothetical protein
MKNQTLQVAAVCSAVFLISYITSGRVFITPRERAFQLEYKTTVKDIPTNAQIVDLWIPIPHDNAFQRITDLQIESQYPYKMHTAEYGNKMLHVRLSKPEQTSFSLTMRLNAVRTEHIQERLREPTTSTLKEESHEQLSQWLKADRLVPIDGKIKQWAQEVVDDAGAKTDLERIRAIYNHVVSTVKYDKTGQGWGRGDIFLRMRCKTRQLYRLPCDRHRL